MGNVCDKCGDELHNDIEKITKHHATCKGDAAWRVAVALYREYWGKLGISTRGLIAQRIREYGEAEQHCPRCKSEEWFPGAACWHCGWEAPTLKSNALREKAQAVVDKSVGPKERGRTHLPNRYYEVDEEDLDALAAALKEVRDGAL